MAPLPPHALCTIAAALNLDGAPGKAVGLLPDCPARSISIHEVAKWGAGMLPLHTGADPHPAVDPAVAEQLAMAVTTHVWRRKFTGRRMPDFYLRSVEMVMAAYETALLAVGLQ
jgi:hypothetical protein